MGHGPHLQSILHGSICLMLSLKSELSCLRGLPSASLHFNILTTSYRNIYQKPLWKKLILPLTFWAMQKMSTNYTTLNFWNQDYQFNYIKLYYTAILRSWLNSSGYPQKFMVKPQRWGVNYRHLDCINSKNALFEEIYWNAHLLQWVQSFKWDGIYKVI